MQTFLNIYRTKAGFCDAVEFDSRDEAKAYLSEDSNGYLCSIILDGDKVVSGTEDLRDEAQDDLYHEALMRKLPFRGFGVVS